MSVLTVQDICMYIYISRNIELSFNEQFSFLRPKVSLQCPLFTFFVYPRQHLILYSCNACASGAKQMPETNNLNQTKQAKESQLTRGKPADYLHNTSVVKELNLELP